jgi:hypothetical protein
MQKVYHVFLGTILFFVTGCATNLQEVTQFKSKAPDLICIAKNEAVRNGFLETLTKEFKKHGADTRLVRGVYQENPGIFNQKIYPEEIVGCDALAFYVAHWRWDLAVYMSSANIWVTDPVSTTKIGQASYTNGGGLDKFIDADKKVSELVDKMYSNNTTTRSELSN